MEQEKVTLFHFLFHLFCYQKQSKTLIFLYFYIKIIIIFIYLYIDGQREQYNGDIAVNRIYNSIYIYYLLCFRALWNFAFLLSFCSTSRIKALFGKLAARGSKIRIYWYHGTRPEGQVLSFLPQTVKGITYKPRAVKGALIGDSACAIQVGHTHTGGPEMTQKQFYKSVAWKRARKAFIDTRLALDGGLCQVCGEEPGLIVHHTIWLDDINCNDPDISLNPKRFLYECQTCHNKERDPRKQTPGRCLYGPNGEILRNSSY